MNRKTLIVGTVLISVGVFLVGIWIVFQQGIEQQIPNMANSQVTQNAQSADSKSAQFEEVLVRKYSPIMGAEDAPVTIVEFFDPACEACRAFYPTLKRIMAEFPDDVRVVVRYTPFHGEASEKAILILEAARLQNLFIPVKEALLNSQEEWASHGAPDSDSILAIAANAGLNLEEAATQMKSPSVIGVLNQDRKDVETVGVQQTPTFFINGEPLSQFGANELVSQVRKEVEKSRNQSESGEVSD
ncbi:DsbA family protein [Ahrensia marina]|uniref:DSBA oxidoreductase n=1 Tax=Ahrensia marina TaxID=1514904 RepID=A0A0M9GKQ0_9HYPH|nr:thioredoxin domain-containing protein [Ahrensia marina]KPB00057.1 DSBA oxidoreductase [Ahrensia marina]